MTLRQRNGVNTYRPMPIGYPLLVESVKQLFYFPEKRNLLNQS